MHQYLELLKHYKKQNTNKEPMGFLIEYFSCLNQTFLSPYLFNKFLRAMEIMDRITQNDEDHLKLLPMDILELNQYLKSQKQNTKSGSIDPRFQATFLQAKEIELSGSSETNEALINKTISEVRTQILGHLRDKRPGSPAIFSV